MLISIDYQDQNGAIDTPEDLAQNETLALGWQAPRRKWSLQKYSGEQVQVEITPRLKSEDMWTLKEAAIHGLGVVALPAYVCREETNSGRLKRVLADWHAGVAQLSLVQPSRKGTSPLVHALQSLLVEELAGFIGKSLADPEQASGILEG